MSNKSSHGAQGSQKPQARLFSPRGAKMREPSMKQVWAGMAMLALLMNRTYEGEFTDIAADAWRMADAMEQEEEDRDEQGSV